MFERPLMLRCLASLSSWFLVGLAGTGAVLVHRARGDLLGATLAAAAVQLAFPDVAISSPLLFRLRSRSTRRTLPPDRGQLAARPR
jgi:hypothetical protein